MMPSSMGARPSPGTTELLEVLDRALSGGIVIDWDRSVHVVKLARPASTSKIVVTTTETHLGHSEPATRKPALLPLMDDDRQPQDRARRHG
jgi:hypothetical protein